MDKIREATMIDECRLSFSFSKAEGRVRTLDLGIAADDIGVGADRGLD